MSDVTADQSWREEHGRGMGALSKRQGSVVESVWLRDDKRGLAIVFADATQAVFEAEGDCCADAWIEAVEGFDFKGRFLGCGNAPDREDSSKESGAYDVLDINFYDFRTERGRLLVELRTSHNGYYAGYLTPRESIEIGENWKQVEL